MVEYPNKKTASANTYENQLTTLPKAAAVSATPLGPDPGKVATPEITITKALIVQIITVSMSLKKQLAARIESSHD